MQIQEALLLYLESNTRVTRPSTIKSYSITVRQFQQLNGTDLTSLTDDNLVRFMRWMSSRGRTPATVNYKAKYLRAFWTWSCKKGYLQHWPTVHSMPEPETVPEAWTMGQLQKLLNACRTQTGIIDGVPAAEWWTSIHLFWFYCGERTEASLSARWDRYDGKTLLVPAEDRKGRCKPMLYEFVPQLADAVEKIREPERERIWPWGKTISSFYNHYKRLIVRAGLPWVRHKTGPQKMRRSYASYLEAAGGDATEGLKHSSSAVTRKSYIDPRIAKRPNQSVLLPRVG